MKKLILAARADIEVVEAVAAVDEAIAEVDNPGVVGVAGINGGTPIIIVLRIREKVRINCRVRIAVVHNANELLQIW